MKSLALAGHAVHAGYAVHAPLAINLNQPGSYLKWSVFTISVANLVLIAVMVVIFGAALLLPFPGRHRPALPPEQVTEPDQIPGYKAAAGDERMWTARLRVSAGSRGAADMSPARRPAACSGRTSPGSSSRSSAISHPAWCVSRR